MASNTKLERDDTLNLGPFTPMHHDLIEGTYINLRPLQPPDAKLLWPEISGASNANLWTYMPIGPQEDFSQFEQIITDYAASTDPLFWSIVTKNDDRCRGYISFLRIDNPNRSIEIGHVLYTRPLQRTTAASEAWFLLAKTAFGHGYRRLEWKCNALNAPSRRAALRYGHTYEGTFRQHMIVKGQNRDTAWFSIVDGEWEVLRVAFEKWISPENFSDDGKQLRSLEEMRAEINANR